MKCGNGGRRESEVRLHNSLLLRFSVVAVVYSIILSQVSMGSKLYSPKTRQKKIKEEDNLFWFWIVWRESESITRVFFFFFSIFPLKNKFIYLCGGPQSPRRVFSTSSTYQFNLPYDFHDILEQIQLSIFLFRWWYVHLLIKYQRIKLVFTLHYVAVPCHLRFVVVRKLVHTRAKVCHLWMNQKDNNYFIIYFTIKKWMYRLKVD